MCFARTDGRCQRASIAFTSRRRRSGCWAMRRSITSPSYWMNSRLMRAGVQTHKVERLLDDVARTLGVVEDVEGVLSVGVVEQIQRHVLAYGLGGEAVNGFVQL